MIPWNPQNAPSVPQPRAANDLSSGFDPSRTGDPLSPNQGRPVIGFGDTRVGSPAGSGDPRRRPIGFAPPEDEAGETRYRTELSFTHHDNAPRASTVPDPSDSSRDPWEAPVDNTVGAEGDIEPGIAEPAPRGDEKVPFYKREISFRRKRPAIDDAPTTAVIDEDEATEIAAALIVTPTAEQHDRDAATAEVVGESGLDHVLADSEPVALAEVDLVLDEFEVVAELDEVEADTAPVVEPVVEPDTAVGVTEDREPAVVFSRDTGESEASNGGDDLFIEDTPEPSRSRLSSFKEKRAEKALTRKPSRGGRSRRVVGLKIGASQIAAAVVAETDEGYELVELARRPLAAGIVVDGEVRDKDALTNALKAFFDEEKLPRTDIRIGLASNRIGVRTLEIAGISDETQFDNAVRFRAHEVLPVAVNESVLDYRVLEERLNEAGEPSRRVLLVVAPRDQVEPFVEVAGRAGLKLAGIDLEALGLLRAFVDPKPVALRGVDDTATVVVAIGHESSTLLVAGGGVCEFTRVFDWGGGALQDAIARELDVPLVEAATILRHLSLSGPGRLFDALDDEARAKAVDAVRTRLTPFARELVSSLQFYQTQPESLGIGGIVITGGTSQLEGLGEALNQMIGVNVTLGDPLTRVFAREGLEPAMESAIGSMAVPIGLAIDDLAQRGVNLLPRDAQKRRSTRSTLIAVGAPVAAVVPLVAIGALYLGAHGTVSSRQSELDAVQAQIAALPKPQGPTIDPALAGADAQRAVGVANVLGGRIAWEQMFRDVARVLPANVWLDAMTATAPAPSTPANAADAATAAAAPTGTPSDVTITGSTYTQVDVARLLARLATLPSLGNVVLVGSTTQRAKDEKPIVKFNIVASLNTAGGTS